MTLTLNDTLVFHPYFSHCGLFCNKVQIENQGESLHSARKCCIFAPAIERTAFCALLGSSLKTYMGHK